MTTSYVKHKSLPMTDFKIERSIPVPHKARDGRHKYPFATMKVGDSFAVPCTDDTVHRVQINAMASTRGHKPKRFTSRVERNGKAVSIRIWRTA